jgi:hypothetical protein
MCQVLCINAPAEVDLVSGFVADVIFGTMVASAPKDAFDAAIHGLLNSLNEMIAPILQVLTVLGVVFIVSLPLGKAAQAAGDFL